MANPNRASTVESGSLNVPNEAAVGSAEEIGDAHIGLTSFADTDILTGSADHKIRLSIGVDVPQTHDRQAGPGVFLAFLARHVQSKKDGAVLSTEDVCPDPR